MCTRAGQRPKSKVTLKETEHHCLLYLLIERSAGDGKGRKLLGIPKSVKDFLFPGDSHPDGY